jgi:hypothetical protein
MSSDNSDNPEWFKKRQRPNRDPFFGDIDDMFKEIERMMDEELKDLHRKSPQRVR